MSDSGSMRKWGNTITPHRLQPAAFVLCESYARHEPGSNYFMESAITTQRGGTQQYDQWTFVLGYRFNNRSSARR